MSSGQCRIQLRRPNAGTAWGFRLQGGLEVNSPLIVQRVFSGTPSDGQLQRGDVLLAIDNQDVSSEYLKKAEELVKASGQVLTLILRRSAGDGPQPVGQQQFVSQSSQPVSRQFGAAPTQSKPQPPSSFSASFDGISSLGQPQRAGKPNVWSPSGGGANYGQPVPIQYSDKNYESPSQSIPPPFSYQPGKKPASDVGSQPPSFSSRIEPSYGQTGGGWQGQQSNQFPAGRPDNQNISAKVQPSPSFQPSRGGDQRYQAAAEISPQYAGSDSIRQVSAPQNQADEEEYETKSVRDIKKMFSQPTPSPSGPSRRYQKPRPAPAVSPSTAGWSKGKPASQYPPYSPPSAPQPTPYSSYPGQSGTFPRQDSVGGRPSVLEPLPPPPQSTPVTRLLTATSQVATPKKSSFGYQGIVTTTPAKPVQGKTPSKPGQKKEFDPTKSLVLQMLQEETERAKRGGGGEEQQEEPSTPRAQARSAGQGRVQQQPRRAEPEPAQRSSRLQDLLDRDQASGQHFEPSQQYQAPGPQPAYYQQSVGYYQQASYPADNYYQQDYGPPSRGYQNASQRGGYQPAYNGGDSIPISDF